MLQEASCSLSLKKRMLHLYLAWLVDNSALRGSFSISHQKSGLAISHPQFMFDNVQPEDPTSSPMSRVMSLIRWNKNPDWCKPK